MEFVYVFTEHADTAVEIQPKKVKGVGLGDIFKNESIKLRSTVKKDEKVRSKPLQGYRVFHLACPSLSPMLPQYWKPFATTYH